MKRAKKAFQSSETAPSGPRLLVAGSAKSLRDAQEHSHNNRQRSNLEDRPEQVRADEHSETDEPERPSPITLSLADGQSLVGKVTLTLDGQACMRPPRGKLRASHGVARSAYLEIGRSWLTVQQ